jgi:FKBP-type peptidyl-prolyl cis-trans isomerase FklB
MTFWMPATTTVTTTTRTTVTVLLLWTLLTSGSSFWGITVVNGSSGTNEEGLAFLANNHNQPGVITLPSGLQYKVLREGSGIYHPSVSSPCLCHYGGTLIDGTTFDSSYDRGEPTTFAPNQVIKGWTEAMQLMVEGDKWEMYIPSELAYGDRGSPPKIEGGAVLIFTMEILKIDDDVEHLTLAMKCNVTTRESCSDKDNTYLEKVKVWTLDKTNTELQRLEKMLSSDASAKLKIELKSWIQRRVKLLQEVLLVNPKATASETDEAQDATPEL